MPMLEEAADHAESFPRCLNCGDELRGRYCAQCGQEAADLRRPVRELLSHLSEDVFSLDSRLLRTLGPLLGRPGFLTCEYFAGRRARYMRPLKTYVVAALVFFGFLALLPGADVSVVQGEDAPAARRPGSHYVTFQLPERYPLFDGPLQEATRRAKEHPRQFADAVFANFPRAFFLLLPAFALLLKLFYRRRDLYYVDHLTFALHYHAFVFLDLSLIVLARRPWVPNALTWILVPLLILGFLLYLPLALHRVYGGPWWKTGFKLMGITVAYLVIFGLGILLLLGVTLSSF